MSVKSIRAPRNPVLIATGLALLLLAALGAKTAAANVNHYRIPTAVLAAGALMDAFLGSARPNVRFPPIEDPSLNRGDTIDGLSQPGIARE